jgi:hypothetical protein
VRMLLCRPQHPDRYVSRLRTIRYGTSACGCSLLGRGEPEPVCRDPPEFPLHGSIFWPRPVRGEEQISRKFNGDHPDAGRTRYRWSSSRDSALEAFRHNPTDVASLHWPIDQERNHMSGPAVPLVLSRTAVSTTRLPTVG